MTATPRLRRSVGIALFATLTVFGSVQAQGGDETGGTEIGV